ncbi:hypothetical protein GCM10023166_16480 [Paeniglutamicibacter cryotolerans]|nr:polysaccharide deacetylase family protein [Paeniglutamicibacter cryotolerans]
MRFRSKALRTSLAATAILALAGCSAALPAPTHPAQSGQQFIAGPGSSPAVTSPPAETSGKRKEPAETTKSPNCAKVKCVALTFDDGPGAYTEDLLNLLDTYQAKATFFVIGKDVQKHPQVLKDTASRGHEIGNHSWAHQDLSKMSVSAAERDLDKTAAAVKQVTGSNPTLIRPPFGALPAALKKDLSTPIALWSIDTQDWLTRDTKKTIKAAEAAKPGSIVLMHDIHESTLKAMPAVLKDLKGRGFHFVTVTQILGKPKPGIGYGTGLSPTPAK